MSYKNPKIAKAVSMVAAFEDRYKAYKNASAKARADYKGQRLHDEEKALFDGLQAEYMATASAVAECVAEMERIKSTRASAGLFETPSEDFKFLTLPVVLTKEQLTKLHGRNIKNELFCQALSQYAEKHYPEEKMMFVHEPDQVSAACAKVAGVLRSFSAHRGVNAYDIGNVVDEVGWTLAGVDLEAADNIITEANA